MNCHGLLIVSGTWYAVQYEDETDLELDMEDAVFAHVRQGTVVALTDDLEYFASQLNIEVSDIVVVENE
jgi:hypothetical protein